MPDNFATAAELRATLHGIASQDIVSMMRAIGWVPERDFAGGDWRGIDFSGLQLRGFNFRNCRLHRAHFRGADVTGADFRGADVSQSTLYLAQGWHAADLDDDQREELALQAANIPPDLGEYVRRIQMAPNFAAAHGIYQEMVEAHVAPNKYALTALMDQAQTPMQAEMIYKRFEEANVEIDNVALNTLMAKMGCYEDRRAIFHEFSKMNIENDSYSFNILLDIYDNVDRKYWLMRMLDSGLKPDRITYNILIRRADSFGEALSYIDKAESGATPLQLDEYDALIRRADKDPENVRLALERLLDAGFKPSAATANAVLSEARSTDEAWSVIATMRSFGLEPDTHSAFALVGVSKGIVDALEQVAKLASLGVRVITSDVVKMLLRQEEGEVRKKAVEICQANGVRHSPALAFHNLVDTFVPEGRRAALLADLFGADPPSR